ncbi:MAG TPA: hypothetical protein ENI46_02005, partial [Firmicutes bacterium]|nr:hypothetical protein [Bacillota bacterium]
FVVWTDYRNSSDGDIYLSRSVLDPPAGVVSGNSSSDWLIRATPNPFSSEIRLELPGESAFWNVGIYDVPGRLVRDATGQGRFFIWDGLNKEGNDVPPGIYFFALTSHRTRRTLKVTLVR